MNLNISKIFQKIREILEKLGKRERMLLLATILIFSIFIPYNYFFKPYFGKIQNLQTQITEAKKKVTELERLAEEVKKNKNEADQQKAGPSVAVYFKGVPEILSYFGGESRDLNLEIVSFNPLTAPAGASTAGPEAGNSLLLELILKGSYQSLVNFFTRIGESKYIISFESINLTPEKNFSSVLQMKSVVKAYYE